MDIMTLEGAESLGMSGREVVDKEGEFLVVVEISFSTWGLVMSCKRTLPTLSLEY